ncbi:single-stranded-DNA-specific exonuclease RecJ [Lichenicoccus sp.]|uniref:single-stranded-DNA-specific exonuclease RecJ n=1 Tax=Lichenicoccus sp. TaxID=2781899 RepID=UPI003D0FD3EE
MAEPALRVGASLSGRRWLWSAQAHPDADRLSAAIAQRCGLPEIVGRLLHGRGISPDAAALFLEPTLRALLPDPSCLIGMDEAAARLADAVRRQETVGIFGDYDVDGACATALLASVLRELGCSVLTHVPDRVREGYGPNAPALLALHASGASLIVCVDCGTAAPEPLAALAGRADVLILDHHKAEGPPPPVLATVNPNRLDCRSGLGSLCATAITFLAAVAALRVLRNTNGLTTAPDLLGLLDLVALATICDVMPLAGLNRAFVTQGLKIMARRHRIGLNALLEIASVQEAPSALTCGFALGPRINAGGRISEADLGLRLLLCQDADEARLLAERLDAVNRQRRHVEAAIIDRALEQAETQIAAGHAVLLLSGPDWHQGVVGIVAGRVKEALNRPTLVAALLDDGTIKGSGRSVSGLDIGTAVIAARQAGLLLTGGGHAMAAGFSLAADKLAAFHAFLDERLASSRDLLATRDLLIDGALDVTGATIELAAHIDQLAPFGAGNEEPVFALARARVVHAERIGKGGNTLRAQLEGEAGGPRLKALLFRAGDTPLARAMEARDGARLHLAGQLRAEEWNGRRTAGFFIVDGAPA